MSGFVLARRLKELYSKDSIIIVDLLDNFSDITIKNTLPNNKRIYFQKDSVTTNHSTAKTQLKFLAILDKLKTISSIDYSLRNYYDIQALPSTREGILEVLKNEDYFKLLFQSPQKSANLCSRWRGKAKIDLHFA